MLGGFGVLAPDSWTLFNSHYPVIFDLPTGGHGSGLFSCGEQDGQGDAVKTGNFVQVRKTPLVLLGELKGEKTAARLQSCPDKIRQPHVLAC